MPAVPRVLIVGPITADIVDGRSAPGGAVTYAARGAAALRVRAAILTVAGPDADLRALAGHVLCVLPARRTLTFVHRLTSSGRSLRVPARPARPLTAEDLPRGWERARLLILAPLLPRDLDLASFASLPAPGGRALLAQGLQRRRGADGRITHLRHPSRALLGALTPTTSVFLSADEVARWSPADMRAVAARSARLVVTRGAAGAEVLHRDGTVTRIPPGRATRVVDATGAGDVFAAAFILALVEWGAGEAAAGRIASALAAAKLRRVGPAPLPAPRREAASG